MWQQLKLFGPQPATRPGRSGVLARTRERAAARPAAATASLPVPRALLKVAPAAERQPTDFGVLEAHP